MKKLFFTAVAVLAFSGAGFAEGKEVKVFKLNCGDFASQVLDTYESSFGCLGSSYNFYYGYVLGLCIGKTT